MTLGDVFALCCSASALLVVALIALDRIDDRRNRKRGRQ